MCPEDYKNMVKSTADTASIAIMYNVQYFTVNHQSDQIYFKSKTMINKMQVYFKYLHFV